GQAQAVLDAAEAEDGDARLPGQRLRRHAQGSQGAGEAGAVDVNVQAQLARHPGQGPQLLDAVEGARLGRLAQADDGRLVTVDVAPARGGRPQRHRLELAVLAL